MACAKWLVQSARPLTLSEGDNRSEPSLRFSAAARGLLPSFRNIHDKILQHHDLNEASARAMATLKGVWAAD